MTAISKVFVVSVIVAAIAYLLKKILDHPYPLDDTLNEKKFQRIKELNMPDLLKWVNENLPEDFTSGKIRVCPKELTSKFIKNSSLSQRTLEKCVYIDVVNEKEEIVLYKVILPESISDDFSVISQGKIYYIPLNS